MVPSYLALGVIVCLLNCPRCCSIPKIEDSIKPSGGWKDETTIEDKIQNSVQSVQAFSFFLYIISFSIHSWIGKVYYTSSTGEKWTAWSTVYFWYSRPLIVIVWRYRGSTSVVFPWLSLRI